MERSVFIVISQNGQPMAAFTTSAAATLFADTAPGTWGSSVFQVAVDIAPDSPTAHFIAQRLSNSDRRAARAARGA
jgi:hypothetical protein